MIEKKNEANYSQSDNSLANYKQRKKPKHIMMGWRAKTY